MKWLFFSSFIAGLVLVGCSDNVTVVNDGSSTGNMSETNVSSTDSNATLGGSSSDADNGTSVYFEFDKFTVDKNSMGLIRKYAKLIIDNNYSVKLEGNADERGSDEYNYALALKRAASVKDILVGYGVNVKNINLISYGESKPRCIEQTQKCYRENRRVDFNIGKSN